MNTSASTLNTARDGEKRPPVAVVKIGGAPLKGGADTAALARDLLRVTAAGWRVVVVHGGGSQASGLMERLAVSSTFVDGLRVTDDAVLSAAVMAFMEVNTNLAAALAAQGLPAVGMAGSAAGLVRARRRRHVRPVSGEPVDLGWVGDVDGIEPAVIDGLWSAGCLPVIAPVGLGVDGHLYNVNADTVAGALAAGLKVDYCLLLTDVPGLLAEAPPPDGSDETIKAAGVVRRLSRAQAESWLADGHLTGGMRPKVRAALTALDGGVTTVRIVDGRRGGVIGRHLLEDADEGTVVGAGAGAGLDADEGTVIAGGEK